MGHQVVGAGLASFPAGVTIAVQLYTDMHVAVHLHAMPRCPPTSGTLRSQTTSLHFLRGWCRRICAKHCCTRARLLIPGASFAAAMRRSPSGALPTSN